MTKLTSEQHLNNILVAYGEIEKIQEEINKMIERAEGSEGWEEYKESIESYKAY